MINSYLGDNATISCCEVLNSLIFPAHEQHHNNSFLCAALVMGQSNIAAGATIGSNHNSRGADGEVIMGRGFWPGLCVSIKHNSIFSSFALLNKGDYNYELNIPIPFSLISNDVAKDELVIMPGYWFLYNFYALARNAWKYIDRDKRITKSPIYEYDYLAPDSVNEMVHANKIIAAAVAKAYLLKKNSKAIQDQEKLEALGKQLLDSKTSKEINALDIFVDGFENSKRKTRLVKCYEAFHMFNNMIFVYGMDTLVAKVQAKKGKDVLATIKAFKSNITDLSWTNMGSQLMPQKQMQNLITKIKNNSIDDWDQVHAFYEEESNKYHKRKEQHALTLLSLHTGVAFDKINMKQCTSWLDQYEAIKSDMTARIQKTREKDYVNAFRKMVYVNDEEMNAVVGDIKNNGFINEKLVAMSALSSTIESIKKQLKAK